jgi:hypothetical protein
MPWYLGNSTQFRFSALGLFIPLLIWSAFWTGLALWHAARRQEKWWFIIFLLVHTVGILEILYLIFVAKIFSPAQAKKVSRPARKR